MAEAIINRELGNVWQAFSAGTKPSGYVHPIALRVLEEAGIQHQGHSKHTDELIGYTFDLVITVCDSAAEECPIWLGKGEVIHNPYIDPSEAVGTEEEVLAVFRQVRDEMIAWVRTWEELEG
jgi:arsenate reductase